MNREKKQLDNRGIKRGEDEQTHTSTRSGSEMVFRRSVRVCPALGFAESDTVLAILSSNIWSRNWCNTLGFDVATRPVRASISVSWSSNLSDGEHISCESIVFVTCWQDENGWKGRSETDPIWPANRSQMIKRLKTIGQVFTEANHFPHKGKTTSIFYRNSVTRIPVDRAITHFPSRCCGHP